MKLLVKRNNYNNNKIYGYEGDSCDAGQTAGEWFSSSWGAGIKDPETGEYLVHADICGIPGCKSDCCAMVN